MASLSDLRVEHYSVEHVPNPHPKGDLPRVIFYRVRNQVIRACRRHGPTGPMGEIATRRWRLYSILGLIDRSPRWYLKCWQSGDENPWYYVSDDQYNDEMYQYLEFTTPLAVTPDWLLDIVTTLGPLQGWGIGVNSLKNGYLLIFADRLLVHGASFDDCKSVDDVIATTRSLVCLPQHTSQSSEQASS